MARWVLVLALLVASQGGDLPPGGTFHDDDGSVHEPSIEAVAAKGLTTGCNPPRSDRFCPGDTVTRAQMAAFLRRAIGLSPSVIDVFGDDDGSIFEGDIDAVAAAGVTRGCNPPRSDEFCPRHRLTRGQLASMLARAFDYDPPDRGGTFDDTTESIHRSGIEALAAAGVTAGCNPPDNDRFCPDEAVSRAQLATFLMRALGLSPRVPPPPPTPGEESCTTGDHRPGGELAVVPGETDVDAPERVWTFRVEVETGLGVDHDCFALEVDRILNDRRGWGADGEVAFRRVDGSSADFRLILASPSTTDALCAPVPTGGIYSCRNGERVVLNVWRWEHGADPFHGDLTTYRQYLVNHEVGHRLGHGHRGCPASGSPAPVMMQQTKYVAPCRINGWPLPEER